MKHRRTQKSKCAECRKTFRHRRGVIFCSHSCQGKNWYRRNPEKARVIALRYYYAHRKRCILESTARQRARKNNPAYRAHVREVARLWYSKNRFRLCAKARVQYAARKKKR
jgi:hypothetical protein